MTADRKALCVCGHKAEHHEDVWIENARPRPGGGFAVWWECRVIGCECQRFQPATQGDEFILLRPA